MTDYIDAENLRGAKQTLMTCTYCGFCKSVCPTYEGIGWDPAVARGRIILAYGLLNRDIPPDDSVVEYLFNCTTCKDCERRCPSGIEVVDVVERARKDLVANGAMLPRHQKIARNVVEKGNPYGELLSVHRTLGRERRQAKLGYFVGCTSAYRKPSIANATLSILDKLGEDFTIVDEACCGSVLQRIGVPDEEVIELVERNLSSIAELGVDEVVFSCSGCYRMFKEEYPKLADVPFKVRHISEFLAEKDLDLAPLEKTLTYHDPCHLGRHCGVYDAPRQLLKRIPAAKFQEMPRNRDTARCCGGGGGVRSAYPDLAKQIAGRRVDEAAFADYLVTACPFCVTNLSEGKEKSLSRAEVKDLVELIEPLVVSQ